MRESRSYGSVRERGGNKPLYSEDSEENFDVDLVLSFYLSFPNKLRNKFTFYASGAVNYLVEYTMNSCSP